MWFFDWFVHSWWMWVFILICLLAFSYEIDFARRVVAKILPLPRISKRFGIYISILVFLIVAGTLLPFSPFLWIWAIKREKAEKKRADERYEEALRRQKEESLRRKAAVEEWLKENKLTLYYNQIDGIMVVLRADDYVFAQKLTAKYKLDGRWEKENVLMPAGNSFVFVNKQGSEAVAKNFGSYKIKGWFSDIYEFADTHGINLEKREDIFVPWTNESVVSYKRQAEMLFNNKDSELYYEFVTKQMPPELRF